MDEKKGFVESSLEYMIKVWEALDLDNIKIVEALAGNKINLEQIAQDIDDSMNNLIDEYDLKILKKEY